MLPAALFLCALLSANLAQAQGQLAPADEEGRFNYIVTFSEDGLIDAHHDSGPAPGAFDFHSAAMADARAQLQEQQGHSLRSMSGLIGRSLQPAHRFYVLSSGMTLRLTPDEARQVAALPSVERVQRDKVYSLDTYRGPSFIGADAVWSGSSTPDGAPRRGEGVIVAILDSGIPGGAHDSFANDPACGHGTTQPDKVLSMLNCNSTDSSGLCNGSSPGDTNGHGSHVASTVAGNLIDETASPAPTIPTPYTEMSGVAPCASIRSYKVCNINGGSRCAFSDSLAGMQSVLIHGDVSAMNFSIGGGVDPWADTDRAKLDLVNAGVFVAASAGNNNTNPEGDVGHLGPWVMSVAAATRDSDESGNTVQGDVLASFSSRGPTPSPYDSLQKPNIAAPGVDIYAAIPGGFDFISGTSMASPHVAGAAALVAQSHPDWTPTEIKSALQMTASPEGFSDDGTTPWNPDEVGHGRADLTKASLAGLVMDETTTNFIAANPYAGGSPEALNLPSMRNVDCSPSCTFTRTVRNTLGTPSGWRATGRTENEAFDIDISPATFNFSGDTSETQTLTITITPGDDLSDRIYFGDITLRENGDQAPDSRMTIAVSGVGGASIDVAPDELSYALPSGNSDSNSVQIRNPGSEPLDWSIRVPEEPLDIPDFSIDPDNPASFALSGGNVDPGYVTGVRFEGELTDIGQGDWASDMSMTVTSPGGDIFSVGGYDTQTNEWDFQGEDSSDLGLYTSAHDNVFGAGGTTDSGTWSFDFAHDFEGGLDMSWEAVSVTLLKQQDICQNVEDIGWLSLQSTSGTVPANQAIDLAVNVDASGLAAGSYQADLCVFSNAVNSPFVQLTVTLDVIDAAAPDEATLSGTVRGLGYCGNDIRPLDAVEVTITGQNTTSTAQTNTSGYYQLNVSESEAPIEISVSASGYVSASETMTMIQAGQTISSDFELILGEPCANVSEQVINAVVEAGTTLVRKLSIGNENGGDSLSWTIETELVAARSASAHFTDQPSRVNRGAGVDASALPAPAGTTQNAGTSAPESGEAESLIAYSTTPWNGYLTLNPNDPSTVHVINPNEPDRVFAAAFIDGDFSQQYALASPGGTIPADTLGTIDVATGAFSSLGVVSTTASGSWTSMKWDATTSTLYAVNYDGGNNYLYTIDPDSLSATLVGNIPADLIVAIAIDRNGLMYGLDIGPDSLLAIDKTDASASVIGPVGVDANFAQDMDFDYNTGTLHWAAYDRNDASAMQTIDTDTGASTITGPIWLNSELMSFSIASAPECVEPALVPWLSISPSSGSIAAGGSDAVDLEFDAQALSPGTYEATVCVGTSDASSQTSAIPVNLNVVAEADIFHDRFEAEPAF